MFFLFNVCEAIKELRAVDKCTWKHRWEAFVNAKLSKNNVADLEAAEFAAKIEAKLKPSDEPLQQAGKVLADLTIAQARCKRRECQRREREREQDREGEREGEREEQ